MVRSLHTCLHKPGGLSHWGESDPIDETTVKTTAVTGTAR